METKQQMTIGKYKCRASYTIVGLTESAKEDFNRLLAKEDKENDEERTAKEI